MSSAVKLYVYDLSNGMARQMSRQLTGRQIDGIWHTSVVVFGKEVFYGQGISITRPGRSHHGQPLQVLDMGETMIDEETFGEYLQEIRDHYTADKYHLLDFNCNSFTNDCIGFLTGNSIPEYIKELPKDFLSTPFGAALRPTIDNMYRRPTPGLTPSPAPTPPVGTTQPSVPSPRLTASILQSVASQAQTPSPAHLRATDTLVAPIHVSTNPASFNALLRTHRAVIADFTSATCPPCRVIEPVFNRLAEERGGSGIAFVRVDLGVGQGSVVAGEWGVRVTPTFIFFLDGKKINDMKGADANELRTQIDLLLFQAFPPHPHTSLSLPAIQALSLSPILFSQGPPAQTKDVLKNSVLPYLKVRFASPKGASLPPTQPSLVTTWAPVTVALCQNLDAAQLFPLTDMWRLAILDPAVATYLATASSAEDPLRALVKASPEDAPRPTLLTVLRLLCNAFSHQVLACVLLSKQWTTQLNGLLIPALLNSDVSVRTAAASLAFNIASFVQNKRVERMRNTNRGPSELEEQDEDWEIEMVSAVVEALSREKENEEIVHRLTASLACFVRLSTYLETQISPLLEVLQVRSMLKSKLAKGGCGESGVTKKEARALIEEVSNKLCPA